MSNFQQLHDLDDEYRDVGQNLAQHLFENSLQQNNNIAVVRNICCVGSLAEGCTVPRVFDINDRYPDRINREIELDMDFLMLEIPEEFKSIVHEVFTKRGIVKVKLDELYCKQDWIRNY